MSETITPPLSKNYRSDIQVAHPSLRCHLIPTICSTATRASLNADNYHAYYNAGAKTLTLNVAALKGPPLVPDDTIVELFGTNRVRTGSDKVDGSSIEVDPNGSLTV